MNEILQQIQKANINVDSETAVEIAQIWLAAQVLESFTILVVILLAGGFIHYVITKELL